ncbi:hypothetical protein [Pimelobacter simplex]|uniref:hypothetical protein n=1 Tax=Nocardioides simplex TaxID=2045 RepID=UPI0019320742|nr:hypothetical protein [Pimelobacter simplex]
MKPISRTVAAGLAAAVTLVPTATEAAGAVPHKPAGKPSPVVKSQVRQLVKDIAGKDRALARVASSKAVSRLGDDNEAVLVAAIAGDRAELADLRAEATAADSTQDARAVRVEVRTYRVELYTQAAGVVRAAEALAVEAADDVEALTFVDLALGAALSVDSNGSGSKAVLKQARAHLESARAELETVDEPEVPVTP